MTDHEDPTTEAGLGPMMDGPHTYKMDAPIDVTNWTVIRTTRDAPNADGTAMESRDEWWHVPTFVVEAIESEARATAPTGLRRSDLKIIEAEASTAHDFIWGTSDVSQEQASAAIWSIHNIVRAALAADSEPAR